MRKVILTLALLVMSMPSISMAGDDPLAKLRPGHPRLFRSAAEFDALKKAVADDPVLQQWYRRLMTDAKEMIESSPISPPLGLHGGQAQLASRRICTLAGLYRIDHDPEYLARAKEELLAVARFPDWVPAMELYFGEMTFGMAVGYDWLYDELTPDERALVRKAIVEKGLQAGIDYYQSQRRWVRGNGNHNQIPNACMIIGALAIGDEETEKSRQAMTDALKSMAYSFKSYDPDGGWDEGPHYWWYGGQYVFRLLAALDSALGDDLGLKATPGLSNTGAFRMATVSPSRQNFNFADDYDRMYPFPSPEMFWLARAYDHTEYAIHERQLVGDKPGIFHLIFCDNHAPANTLPTDTPRDAMFRNVDVACFRSAWNDSTATYVGFKGGWNRIGHWHLDIGSFVFESQGERFAIDLGREVYQLPGYFGRQRYDYFRANNASHNTLTINGQRQDPAGKSPIVAFQSTDDKAYAVADMSAAYKMPAQSLRRGVALLQRRDLLVQDDIESTDAADIVWNMYTRADIKLDGRKATLTLRGTKLYAQIVSPADASFQIGSANAPKPQTQQPDVHSLRIHLTTKAPQQIAVFLSPQESAAAPALEPLAKWIAASPVK